jgi:hypothetical protein
MGIGSLGLEYNSSVRCVTGSDGCCCCKMLLMSSSLSSEGVAYLFDNFFALKSLSPLLTAATSPTTTTASFTPSKFTRRSADRRRSALHDKNNQLQKVNNTTRFNPAQDK